MKIRCYILRKDRTVQIKKKSARVDYIVIGEESYNVDKGSVNLSAKPSKFTNGGFVTNPTPELLYVEGISMPICVKDGKKTDDAGLDEVVISELLKDISGIRKNPLKQLIGALWDDPGRTILFGLVAIIGSTVVYSLLKGVIF